MPARAARLLSALALLSSAALLFASEPMVARMLLAAAGGAAAVWTTSLVFFQVTLLAGYLYAHQSVRRLPLPAQVLVHAALLAASSLVLPLAPETSGGPPPDGAPAVWLLRTLAVTLGPPFFALSASALLVQSWLARARLHDDAYRLYSASNLGSLAGLMAYPLLVEPRLALAVQSRAWAAAYGVAAALVAACGAVALRLAPLAPPAQQPAVTPPPGAGVRLRWLALAGLPASLTLSVTTYITTDLAAIPLMWVLPLSLYLATYVVAFAHPGRGRWALMVAPVAVLPPVVSLLAESTRPAWLQVPTHLLTFFIVSLACHQALARSRPDHGRLPEFYLWLALGGALGAVLTAIGAPLAFSTTLEYPIGLLLACYLGTAHGRRHRAGWLDVAGPMSAALMVAGLAGLAGRLGWAPSALATLGLTYGPALLVAAMLWPWPRRFVATIAAVFAAGMATSGTANQTLLVARSFYGVHRVQEDDGRRFHVLVDGSTIHGVQRLDPDRRRECTGYYSRMGPVGDVLGMIERSQAPREVGVLGLGAGSMACYARLGQRWTFFEIDPTVVTLAQTSGYFSYLADSPAEYEIVLGDARLSLDLRREPAFGVLVVDVFSSDAIPVHLLTREAFRTYLRRLAPGGRILVHVSNLYLNLRHVVAASAAAEGLTAVARRHQVDEEAASDGVFPSEWVLLGRSVQDLGDLASDQGWESVPPDVPAWSDDHAPLVSAFDFARSFGGVAAEAR